MSLLSSSFRVVATHTDIYISSQDTYWSFSEQSWQTPQCSLIILNMTYNEYQLESSPTSAYTTRTFTSSKFLPIIVLTIIISRWSGPSRLGMNRHSPWHVPHTYYWDWECNQNQLGLRQATQDRFHQSLVTRMLPMFNSWMNLQLWQRAFHYCLFPILPHCSSSSFCPPIYAYFHISTLM